MEYTSPADTQSSGDSPGRPTSRLARTFWDLETYRLANGLAQEVFELSRQFPPEERYALTDQIRRSSRSVGAQIAEGWGKRRYVKTFVTKLVDANGEQSETQHWIGVAVRSGYIDRPTAVKLVRRYEDLGRMIDGMIVSAHKFSTMPDEPAKVAKTLRESPAEYYVDDDNALEIDAEEFPF